MPRFVRYACFISLLFPGSLVFSQVEVLEDLIPDTELQVYRHYSGFGQIHGNGFGFGFRYGRIKSIEKSNFQEFEFLQLKHPKAQRQSGWGAHLVGNSRRFIWGGVNQLFALRYGLGMQRTINEKPYWGGVQVGYTLAGGAVLGLAIPQYLNILHLKEPLPPPGSNENPWEVRAERYDPNNHKHNELSYINGMGPMFKGLGHLRPYPGVYGKFGFNFEFGKYLERISAVEVGVMIDVFPIPVPMMAISCPDCNNDTGLKTDQNFFFANFYLAYHFGGRK
ncbi:MAG: hypothetical protein FWG79_05460 [Bacteroidales bacterium]|nr:hypothetical protein [Bacteroidales bacterium]